MPHTSWSIDRGRIHVESVIRAPLRDVLRSALTPELHEQWDVRFSSIRYIPKARDEDPQRFEYARRIAPGVEIRGWGVTRHSPARVGHAATSTLEFGSASALSLIRTGAGYWRFAETPDGVLFSTEYDYDTRWGRIGRWLDRIAFRRAMGWLTARSFERLRTRLETGEAE